ncbi:MAG: hypothetical protein MHM6MM_008201 [Cercozoa sp. M6MM]
MPMVRVDTLLDLSRVTSDMQLRVFTVLCAAVLMSSMLFMQLRCCRRCTKVQAFVPVKPEPWGTRGILRIGVWLLDACALERSDSSWRWTLHRGVHKETGLCTTIKLWHFNGEGAAGTLRSIVRRSSHLLEPGEESPHTASAALVHVVTEKRCAAKERSVSRRKRQYLHDVGLLNRISDLCEDRDHIVPLVLSHRTVAHGACVVLACTVDTTVRRALFDPPLLPPLDARTEMGQRRAQHRALLLRDVACIVSSCNELGVFGGGRLRSRHFAITEHGVPLLIDVSSLTVLRTWQYGFFDGAARSLRQQGLFFVHDVCRPPFETTPLRDAVELFYAAPESLSVHFGTQDIPKLIQSKRGAPADVRQHNFEVGVILARNAATANVMRLADSWFLGMLAFQLAAGGGALVPSLLVADAISQRRQSSIREQSDRDNSSSGHNSDRCSDHSSDQYLERQESDKSGHMTDHASLTLTGDTATRTGSVKVSLGGGTGVTWRQQVGQQLRSLLLRRRAAAQLRHHLIALSVKTLPTTTQTPLLSPQATRPTPPTSGTSEPSLDDSAFTSQSKRRRRRSRRHRRQQRRQKQVARCFRAARAADAPTVEMVAHTRQQKLRNKRKEKVGRHVARLDSTPLLPPSYRRDEDDCDDLRLLAPRLSSVAELALHTCADRRKTPSEIFELLDLAIQFSVARTEADSAV